MSLRSRRRAAPPQPVVPPGGGSAGSVEGEFLAFSCVAGFVLYAAGSPLVFSGVQGARGAGVVWREELVMLLIWDLDLPIIT